MANECHKELKVSFTQAFIGQLSAYGYQPRKLPNTLLENASLNSNNIGLFVGTKSKQYVMYLGMLKPCLNVFNFLSCLAFLCRFFTEEECIGTCKDAKRTNKKKGVCPHAAPICQPGCVLGKENNDQGTCLTCICNKNQAAGEYRLHH